MNMSNLHVLANWINELPLGVPVEVDFRLNDKAMTTDEQMYFDAIMEQLRTNIGTRQVRNKQKPK
jgi:hypothetical protein